MTSHPTVGVEEEFLLIDPQSGEPIARNKQVAAHAAEHGVDLQLELTSCQVETTTDVMDTSAALRRELTRLRQTATEAAAAPGRSCWPSACRRPCRTNFRSHRPPATAGSPTGSA